MVDSNGGTIMLHKLPELSYAYDALEPYFDKQTTLFR